MVRALRPQPDAGTIIQPKSAFLGLLLRDLKPFLPPDPLNALVIYMPAAVVQQPSNHAISITAKLFGQRSDVLGQPGFVRYPRASLACRPSRRPPENGIILSQKVDHSSGGIPAFDLGGLQP